MKLANDNKKTLLNYSLKNEIKTLKSQNYFRDF